MASGTLTYSGTLIGFPSGQRTINMSFMITSAVDDAMSLTLAVGDNVIVVPSNANGVIIEPPAGNSVIVSLSGAGASIDAVGLHPTLPLIWHFPVTLVSFVLNCPSPFFATTPPSAILAGFLAGWFCRLLDGSVDTGWSAIFCFAAA